VADAIENNHSMPANLVTGASIAPFEIDYENGCVKIPEPVIYAPLVSPFRGGKQEELSEVPAHIGQTGSDVSDWTKVAGSSPSMPTKTKVRIEG
jgi:hypothetical protein